LHLLREIREETGVRTVEDCAQSVGASFHGTFTGTVGEMAATSFYPTKNLGGIGDGGAILTNSAEFEAQARTLRFYGETTRYHHDYIGYNSRLDELQAALLLRAQLPRLQRWIERRRAIAERYNSGLRHSGVKVHQPLCPEESSRHLFPVFVEPALRDALPT
jgi:dTDP-4-amino-4,6-dideoxygalactose transaminase